MERTGDEKKTGGQDYRKRDLSRKTSCRFFRNDVMQDFNNSLVGFKMCRHLEMPGDHRKYHIILKYLTTTIHESVCAHSDTHTHTHSHTRTHACTHTHTSYPSFPFLSLTFHFSFPLFTTSFFFLSPFLFSC